MKKIKIIVIFCLLNISYTCIASSILYDTLAVATQVASTALPSYNVWQFLTLHNKNSDLEIKKIFIQYNPVMDSKTRFVELVKVDHELTAFSDFQHEGMRSYLPLGDLLLRSYIVHYLSRQPHASLLPSCTNIVTALPTTIEYIKINRQHADAKKKADEINFDNLDDHLAAQLNGALVDRVTGKKIKKDFDGNVLYYIKNLRRYNFQSTENRESNYQPIDYKSQLLLLDKHRVSQGKTGMSEDVLLNITGFCSQPFESTSKEKIAKIHQDCKKNIGELDNDFYRKFPRAGSLT